MHTLGATRSAHRYDHLLQTPDTFVRTTLPCLRGGLAIVHIAPAGGAAFLQYTVEFEATGELTTSGLDRFLFCLKGSLELTTDHQREHAAEQAATRTYLPRASTPFAHWRPAGRLLSSASYLPADNELTPHSRRVMVGDEASVASTPLLGDEAIEVRQLLPASPELDFAVNLMTYRPGASLSMVEIHVMEHGLLMLEGGGIYRLGDAWYPVTAGDFIWMAPFCPQWFGALGKTPAKYLIYKDANRHPLLP